MSTAKHSHKRQKT